MSKFPIQLNSIVLNNIYSSGPLYEEEHVDVHSPKATPNTGMLLDIKKLNLTPKSEIRRSLENTHEKSAACQRMVGYEEVGESTEKELLAHKTENFAEDFDQMFNQEVEVVKKSHNISITDLCDSITKLDLDCSLEQRNSLSKNTSPYVPGEVRTEIHNLGNLLMAEANKNSSTVFISQEEEEELLGGAFDGEEEEEYLLGDAIDGEEEAGLLSGGPDGEVEKTRLEGGLGAEKEDQFDGNISQFDELLDQDLEVLRSKSPKPVPKDIDMSEIAKYFEDKYNNSFDQATEEPFVKQPAPSEELHDLESIHLDRFVPVSAVTSTLDSVETGLYEGVGESSFLYKSLDIPQNEESFVVLPESGEERLSGNYFERMALQASHASTSDKELYQESVHTMFPEQVYTSSSEDSVIVIPEPTVKPQMYEKVSDTDLSAYLAENRSNEKEKIVTAPDYKDVSETDLSEYLGQDENSNISPNTKPETDIDAIAEHSVDQSISESCSLAGRYNEISSSSLSEPVKDNELKTSNEYGPELYKPTTETHSPIELCDFNSEQKQEEDQNLFKKEISPNTGSLLAFDLSPTPHDKMTDAAPVEQCFSLQEEPNLIDEVSEVASLAQRCSPEQDDCEMIAGEPIARDAQPLSTSLNTNTLSEDLAYSPEESTTGYCPEILASERQIPETTQEHLDNKEVEDKTATVPVAMEEEVSSGAVDLEEQTIEESSGIIKGSYAVEEDCYFSILEEPETLNNQSILNQEEYIKSLDQKCHSPEEETADIAKDLVNVEADPARIKVDPITFEIDQGSVEDSPVSVEVEPVNIDVDPVSVEDGPVSVENDPINDEVDPVITDVDLVSVEDERVSVEVEPVNIDVDPVTVEVDPVSFEDYRVSVEVEPVNIDVDPVSVEDGPVSVENDPTNDEVDPVITDVDLVSVEDDRVSVEVEPVNIDVDPVTVEDSPVSVEVDTINFEVDPVITDVDPVSVEDSPVSVEVDPINDEVDPVITDVDPMSVEDSPVSVEVDPINDEVDPVITDVDPVSVEDSPVSVEIDPINDEVDPVITDVDPVSVEYSPVSVEVDPINDEVDPVITNVDPVRVEVDPTNFEVDPVITNVDPVSVEDGPVSVEVDPITFEVDPVITNVNPVSVEVDLGDCTTKEDVTYPQEDLVSANVLDQFDRGSQSLSEDIMIPNHNDPQVEPGEMSDQIASTELEIVTNLSRTEEQEKITGESDVSSSQNVGEISETSVAIYSTEENELFIARPDFLEEEEDYDSIAPLCSRDSMSSVKSRESLGLLPPSYLANIDNDDLFISQVNSPSVLFGDKEKSYLRQVLKAPSPVSSSLLSFKVLKTLSFSGVTFLCTTFPELIPPNLPPPPSLPPALNLPPLSRSHPISPLP